MNFDAKSTQGIALIDLKVESCENMFETLKANLD
jgi:hypothetical protein